MICRTHPEYLWFRIILMRFFVLIFLAFLNGVFSAALIVCLPSGEHGASLFAWPIVLFSLLLLHSTITYFSARVKITSMPISRVRILCGLAYVLSALSYLYLF